MCVLCGELIMNAHWTDQAKLSGGMTDQRQRRRSRLKRAEFANRILSHYGLSLSDWNGAKYTLADKKGGSVLVQDLGDLWPAVQKFTGKIPDPLDARLLCHMASGGGANENRQ